jgi:hypothetical protein
VDKKVERYFQLKQRQKEIEQELSELRKEIVQYCTERELSDWHAGEYRVRLVLQERREYDDNKLYKALPDPDIWRMISKADAAKISGLVKLNVITEESIRDTYSVKSVPLLQVEKT